MWGWWVGMPSRTRVAWRIRDEILAVLVVVIIVAVDVMVLVLWLWLWLLLLPVQLKMMAPDLGEHKVPPLQFYVLLCSQR
jgi:hypothetical protein